MVRPACSWGGEKCPKLVTETWRPKMTHIGKKPVQTMYFCEEHGVRGAARAALVGHREGVSHEMNVQKYQETLIKGLRYSHVIEKYKPEEP